MYSNPSPAEAVETTPANTTKAARLLSKFLALLGINAESMIAVSFASDR
jgi:hypothetical protein